MLRNTDCRAKAQLLQSACESAMCLFVNCLRLLDRIRPGCCARSSSGGMVISLLVCMGVCYDCSALLGYSCKLPQKVPADVFMQPSACLNITDLQCLAWRATRYSAHLIYTSSVYVLWFSPVKV